MSLANSGCLYLIIVDYLLKKIVTFGLLKVCVIKFLMDKTNSITLPCALFVDVCSDYVSEPNL